MLFNSYIFILGFLPVVIAGYYILNHSRKIVAGKAWLLLCSFFFYGWWNPEYVFLLGSSVIVNFLVSSRIIAARNKSTQKNCPNTPAIKRIFLLGVLFNIGLLGYFKYANFFVDNVNTLFQADWFLAKIALPLAISFFTLQQIAYLVDVYEGLAEEKKFIDYALFVTFFPQLIAGPIVHHKEMMPQFANLRTKLFHARNFSIGLFVFSVGLFKKVVIADSFSIWVNNGYDSVNQLTMLEAWMTSLSYTFQMYYDFSGYADMAIGLGLMFNIRIPINFDSPYRATSIINYWDRWHITLSKFISTYVYTPVLKYFPGKIGFAKAMVATLLAMMVSGIWHGAAWTFVIWGIFHGIGLVINHSWRRKKIAMPAWCAWLITFLFVNYSLVIFRSEGVDQLQKMTSAMLGMGAASEEWYRLMIFQPLYSTFLPFISGIYRDYLPLALASLSICCAMAACLVFRNSNTFAGRFKPNAFYLSAQVVLFIVPIFMMDNVSEFLYFQF